MVKQLSTADILSMADYEQLRPATAGAPMPNMASASARIELLYAGTSMGSELPKHLLDELGFRLSLNATASRRSRAPASSHFRRLS